MKQDQRHHIFGTKFLQLLLNFEVLSISFQAVVEQGPKLSKEEMMQMEKEAKMQAEVDREHEEQMRLLREKKRKEKEPPPPPKTITVMAGT